MHINKQVALRYRREPLQISYPPDFNGQKSDINVGDDEFFLNNEFRLLTIDEIELAGEYIKQLPYKQELEFGAVLIDPEDPLLEESHENLNKVEGEVGLPSSEFLIDGSRRNVLERVLLIRERGYLARGSKILAGGE